jgi:hypothetical protein
LIGLKIKLHKNKYDVKDDVKDLLLMPDDFNHQAERVLVIISLRTGSQAELRACIDD